jgi:hypothetical protein
VQTPSIDKSRYFAAVGYTPHLAQAQIHASRARYIVAVCGRRFGKSLLAARETEMQALLPRRRVWIVAPYYSLAQKVFREVWATLVTRLRLPTERASERDGILCFPWQSTVEAKSADSPESLLGEGLDFLVVDEAARVKREIWERYLSPTLLDRRGRALFITTPEGMNWVYDLYIRGGDSALPDWASFRFPTSANPLVAPADIAAERAALPPETFARELEAEFVSPSGLVYPEFDPALFVRDAPLIPDLPVYRAIDFGYANPFCCLDVQADDGGQVRVVAEYYRAGASPLTHARHLLDTEDAYRRMQRHPRPILYCCDPAGADGRAVLMQMGIPTSACRSHVLAGIEQIRRALLPRARVAPRIVPWDHRLPSARPNAESPMTPDADVGLVVDKSCVNLIREFGLYRYAESGDMPVKENDHALDALRYFFANFGAALGVADSGHAPPASLAELDRMRGVV